MPRRCRKSFTFVPHEHPMLDGSTFTPRVVAMGPVYRLFPTADEGNFTRWVQVFPRLQGVQGQSQAKAAVNFNSGSELVDLSPSDACVLALLLAEGARLALLLDEAHAAGEEVTL